MKSSPIPEYGVMFASGIALFYLVSPGFAGYVITIVVHSGPQITL